MSVYCCIIYAAQHSAKKRSKNMQNEQKKVHRVMNDLSTINGKVVNALTCAALKFVFSHAIVSILSKNYFLVFLQLHFSFFFFIFCLVNVSVSCLAKCSVSFFLCSIEDSRFLLRFLFPSFCYNYWKYLFMKLNGNANEIIKVRYRNYDLN